MNKKTIVISALSSLLVTGGIAGAATILINAANRNDGISLNEGAKFSKEDIQKLLNSFQEQINKNKYSAEQFKIRIIDVVKSSLTLNNKPAFTLVKSANFDVVNNEIVITLNEQYEYSLSETYNDIVLDTTNKTITISNLKLQFYDSCVIVNTIGLFNAIQNYIDTNKSTIHEISQELQIENSQFVDLIYTNLLIDNNGINQPILVDNIKNIEINNNKIEITLDANYLSYSITNNNNSANVELKANKIIISNLNFYSAIVIENLKLNELQNNIQSLINTNQYTLNDFNNQLASLTFKNQIANYLNIDIADIKIISFDQGILKIIPKLNAKFISSLNNNLIVDDTIQITNLEFYNSITLTKLNNLYTALNTYIAQQKLTLDAFKNQVNSNDLQIRNLIKNNLFVLNSDGNEQTIEENKIKSFEFINNQVEVQLDTNFMKYIVTSTDQNVVLENNKIIIKNLDYFEIISIDINNLNNLKQNIQNLININQWTQNDFNNQLSLETFKTEIAKYLNINVNVINAITFTNDVLEISSPVNKKFEASSFSSLITPNFTIQVRTFNFYTVANLTQLDVLYNAINTYIANHKFTINEFESEVNDNKEAIKQLIIDNLKVNTQTIDSNWIETISFINNNDNPQLEITLNNYYIRYELKQTNNVKFENNKLIISKLQYCTTIEIDNSRLNNLKQNIQNFIQNSVEQFTIEEFKNQLNSNKFKTKISEFLDISINAIGNISCDNDVLKIMPNINYKFICNKENILIVDYYIQLEDLILYQSYELTNLDKLYNEINNYISLDNNKFTEFEFANNVSSTPNNIKQVIANNLELTESGNSQNIDISYISNVQYINNQLEITLSNDYLKYQLTPTDNVELENNKLIVKNLNFYQLININIDELNNLRTQIIKLIDDEEIDENNINTYLTNEIYDLVKNININNNLLLEQFITTPTYENSAININLKSNIGLYKFISNSNSNIEITYDNIALKNISLWVAPEESPVNWFTWDGTKITGLSELGKKENKLVLPSITTSLSQEPFILNKNITYIDLSSTKITVLPDGAGQGLITSMEFIRNTNFKGVFSGMKFLKRVILPKNLEIIGLYVFSKCTSLISIDLPETIKNIREGAFVGCENLRNFKIPPLLTTISNSMFTGCINLNNILISNNINNIDPGSFRWCNSLININIPNTVSRIQRRTFEGCEKLSTVNLPNNISTIDYDAFKNCNSLEKINIPNNLTSIGNNAFDGCSKLSEIILPNTVTSIGTGAFDNIPNLVIYVSDNNVENILRNVFSGTIINLNRP